MESILFENVSMNIKNFKNLFFLIVSFFLSLSIANVCYAQSFKHASTNKVLEFSLKSLKESAKELEEKNKWLITVMREMKQQIGQMRYDMEVLEKKKKNLANSLEVVTLSLSREKEETSLAKQGMDRIEQQVFSLQKEKDIYQNQVDARISQEKEINEKIMVLKEDVLKIDSEMSEKKSELFQESPQKEIVTLALTESKEKIRKLGKEIDVLERKFGKPLRDVVKHREKKNRLQVKFKSLEKDYQTILGDIDALEEEIESKKSQKAQTIGMLTSEIKLLKSKSKELEKVLFQANRKLKGVSLNSSDIKKHHQRLERNVSLVKKENISLQKELSLLKKKLKKSEKEYISLR